MGIVITTERLTLRRYNADDAIHVAGLLNNPEVSKWLTRVPYPYSVDDAKAFFDREDTKDNLVFAIAMADKPIGGISLTEELGYWLGQPYWGKGFATEASHALLEHYFTISDGPVRSGHILGNAGSRGVLRKLGFIDQQIELASSLSVNRDVEVQKMHLSKTAWEAAQ